MSRGHKYFCCAVVIAAIEFAVVLCCLIPCRQGLQEATVLAEARNQPSLPSLSRATPIDERKKVRFLWGIMTTLRPKDAIRREIIRRTYLSYYQDHPLDRICSIQEVKDKPSCQLVYTFVVGANPEAPMDLVDYHNASHSLILEQPEHLDNDIPYEDDITYLNLQENMESGKMPSWFHYANTLVDKYQIDYIAKVDSDTILFPDNFFDFVETTLPPHGRRVYGGIPYDALNCGGYRRDYCDQMVGKTYMSGELYFMSADLSKFITSPQLNRSAVRIPKEDMCTGNFVHSHPQPLLEAVVSPRHALWEHGDHLKEPQHYEQRWNKLMRKNPSNNIRREWSLSSLRSSFSGK